eukprot:TRINITY_DN172_c0_g1_i1.p1 TRINITY_DN172_c0_g1~~TRINITY_DN172_c0_g1_i1.p1  ORF type:complete len:208 (-),score=68.23 TRINITY_DN172_c0_g1_i1:194-817(-)
MAALPKLVYFNARGRAEAIRLIFAEAGVEYEDVRLAGNEWPAYKAAHNLPFGQIPILEMDGKVLSQSVAITRYLAKKYNLVPANDYDAYLCDCYADGINDLRNAAGKAAQCPPEQKEAVLKQFAAEVVPVYAQRYEGFLHANSNGEGFFVGNELTWADLFIFDFFFTIRHRFADSLNEAPLLTAFLDRIAARPNISAWMARRPFTEI